MREDVHLMEKSVWGRHLAVRVESYRIQRHIKRIARTQIPSRRHQSNYIAKSLTKCKIRHNAI